MYLFRLEKPVKIIVELFFSNATFRVKVEKIHFLQTSGFPWNY